MENKELTKLLLANALKELMTEKDFFSITIKMITDRAGVIRPTFYRHFRDKCDVLEFIAKTELLKKAFILTEGGMYREAMIFLLNKLRQEQVFYRKAFLVTGQNGFPETLTFLLEECILRRLEQTSGDSLFRQQHIDPRLAARKYAFDFVGTMKLWVFAEQDAAAEQYIWLLNHSLFALLE